MEPTENLVGLIFFCKIFCSLLDNRIWTTREKPDFIWPDGQKSYSLKSLLYNLAFVHRAYSMTYTTRSKKVDELFLPLYAGDMPKYYQGNDGKAYLRVELEKEYIKGWNLGKEVF